MNESDKTIQQVSRSEQSVVLSTRVTEKEKELWEKMASEDNMSSSQALRKVFLGALNNNEQKKNAAELSRKSFAAATKVRSIFKSCCAEISDMNSIIKQQIPLQNSEVLHKDMFEIKYVLSDIQKALNEYLSDYKVKEIHTVARPSSSENNQKPASLPDARQPQIRIRITGTIVREAGSFISKSGAKMYKMLVAQKSVKSKETVFFIYDTFDEQTVSRYHVGDVVTLEGDLDVHTVEKEGKVSTFCRVFNPEFL